MVLRFPSASTVARSADTIGLCYLREILKTQLSSKGYIFIAAKNIIMLK